MRFGRGTVWMLVILSVLFLSVAVVAGADGNRVVVTDALGRQVEIPSEIEKIACLYAFTGHAVILLGLGDQLVAVSGGLTREAIVVRLHPHVATLSTPRRGGVIHVEELLRTEADVVFIRASDIADEREREKLELTNIPYVTVEFDTMEEQMDTIELMGEVLGRAAQAREYTDFYRSTVARVTEGLGALPQDQRVSVFHSTNQPTRTYSDGLSADWTNILAHNVTSGQELRGGRQDASIEQILMWDPDVILVNAEEAKNHMLTDSQWAPLQAVKGERVHLLPIGVTRFGHHGSLEIPMAMLWAAQTLYPDVFTDLDLVAETQAFYHRFFHVGLDVEEVEEVLAGKGMRAPK